MASYKITPVSRALGARISGVDLSKPIDTKLQQEIYADFVKYQALVFPDQNLTPKDHIRIAGYFGKPTTNDDLLSMSLKDYPEVLTIENDELRPPGADFWHTDQCARTTPSKATLLYAIKTPSIGGDTMVLNMHTAYETLSPTMQKMLEGLTCIHSEKKAFGEEFAKIQNMLVKKGIDPYATFSKKEDVFHPLIAEHQESKRKTLWISYPHIKKIKELNDKESHALLSFLYRHSEMQEFMYRHVWNEKDLLIWDNRCTQHLGVADYFPEYRLLHKITVT